VDVAAEAPPLRAGHGAAGSGQASRDEISRVGQAFDQVRQTAIRAAVDEANLRRGLNDVFRSLARRSQSLLHRQLALLDQMERRARDPEALDDLFRLDHLTTRMRRHAEGLVILAGAAPSRAWSNPVRMVDVMRGAIAEVEDYARVSVAIRSQAALAGPAVADVIHLLAELVENATTLSPPYTSVRVSGDAVASGFVIEVEDRGLGMSPQRLGELNERLASPPEFNPSDSEQLGLFVVSQLAKRHGIRVTLKASPYGGTSAVVLIPAQLVVTEEAFRAGLPGEPTAISTGPDAGAAANGNHLGPGQAGPEQIGMAQIGTAPAGPVRVGPVPGGSVPPAQAGSGPAGPGQASPAQAGPGDLRGRPELAAQPFPEAAGIRISGPLRRTHKDVPAGSGPSAGGRGDRGHDGAAAEPANGAVPGFDVFTPLRRSPDAAGPRPPADRGPAPEASGPADPAGSPQQAGAQPASYVSAPTYPAAPPHPAIPAAPGYPGSPAYPAAQTYPGAGAVPTPDQPTRMTPVASPGTGPAASLPSEPPSPAGPPPSAAGAADAGPDDGTQDLPRRVKQASLAPQLRDNPPRRRTSAGTGAAGAAGADGPTPDELRKTMSALQRGWQGGRSEPMSAPAAGDPPSGPSGQSQPEGAAGERGTAADESPGGSDGT
jgi:hypothetical protein